MNKLLNISLIGLISTTLVACGNSPNVQTQEQRSISEEKKADKIQIYTTDFDPNIDSQGYIYISGRISAKGKISAEDKDGNELDSTTADTNGLFSLKIDGTQDKQEVSIKSGNKRKSILILPLDNDFESKKINRIEKDKIFDEEVKEKEKLRKEADDKIAAEKDRIKKAAEDKRKTAENNSKIVEKSEVSSSSAETQSQTETFDKTISKDQQGMLQATTQIALERNGFKDDTSSELKNWTFAKNERDGKLLWNSITTSKSSGRIKAIFQWTGFDSDKEQDDLILVYLLVNGNEITNNLESD